jgi:cyclic pyranopterin phosphate synthase
MITMPAPTLAAPDGRVVDYLRISITDRCNERCLYCMPEGYKGWQARADTLTDDELVRVARLAAGLGFRKFRITGGEPLVRKEVVDIIGRIWEQPGVETIGLSTNGVMLEKLAAPLRQAGLTGINVSLDALDPAVYHRVTGGDLAKVLAGLEAARAAGFERIKLNCVLMRGVNEQEIWPLVEYAAARHFPMRFIELMPLTRRDVLNESNFFPIAELLAILRDRDELAPVEKEKEKIGNGPARYYRLRRIGALVGVIGALTEACFCERCNKMRVTADGKLRPCLGDALEFDLLPALRGGTDDDVIAVFNHALARKPLAHGFRDVYQPARPMTAIGG